MDRSNRLRAFYAAALNMYLEAARQDYESLVNGLAPTEDVVARAEHAETVLTLARSAYLQHIVAASVQEN